MVIIVADLCKHRFVSFLKEKQNDFTHLNDLHFHFTQQLAQASNNDLADSRSLNSCSRSQHPAAFPKPGSCYYLHFSKQTPKISRAMHVVSHRLPGSVRLSGQTQPHKRYNKEIVVYFVNRSGDALRVSAAQLQFFLFPQTGLKQPGIRCYKARSVKIVQICLLLNQVEHSQLHQEVTKIYSPTVIVNLNTCEV